MACDTSRLQTERSTAARLSPLVPASPRNRGSAISPAACGRRAGSGRRGRGTWPSRTLGAVGSLPCTGFATGV